MKSKYFIFGASGHGKVAVDVVQSTGIVVQTIIDDNPKSKTWQNILIKHTSEVEIDADSLMLIAVGNNSTRKKIVSNNSFSYFKAIHQQATVATSVMIGEGSVIMAQVVMNANAKIGSHCIINTAAVIEHDCEIGNFVHVSPNASIAGNVTIGEGTHIGIGAIVIQGVTIGKWTTIGAGTVVIRDVPDYAVVVGNPGRIIKYNTP